MTDPFPYDEEIDVLDLVNNINDADLVAVKIGDVNGSTSANINNDQNGIAPRSNPVMKLKLENVIIDGKSYIEFRASETGLLYGFQFGATYTGYDIKGIQRGMINITPDMVALDGRLLKVSYSDLNGVSVFADQVLFRLMVDIVNDSATLSIDGQSIVPAEIYQDALDVHNLEFEWNEREVKQSTAFRLDQNEPNPFKVQTSIGFYMPEDGEATFNVFDIDGKILYTRTEQYTKGEHDINLLARDIHQTGMVIYEISGEGFVGSKKMIVIQ